MAISGIGMGECSVGPKGIFLTFHVGFCILDGLSHVSLGNIGRGVALKVHLASLPRNAGPTLG